MDTAEFVNAFPFFKKAPRDLLRDLASAGQNRSLPAGSRIYAEGDVCSSIAFVLAGEIRVFKIGETGREITLYEIGSGETCILNASCIFSHTGYPAHAVANAETKVVLVDASAFRKLVQEYEEMRDFVFTLLSRRLSLVMELVEEIAFGRMDRRLTDYLVEKSENGVLAATHQKIANDLGTSREVVSRLLKDFERQGIVQLSRNSIALMKQARPFRE